jgi:hypothetical protein
LKLKTNGKQMLTALDKADCFKNRRSLLPARCKVAEFSG